MREKPRPTTAAVSATREDSPPPPQISHNPFEGSLLRRPIFCFFVPLFLSFSLVAQEGCVLILAERCFPSIILARKDGWILHERGESSKVEFLVPLWGYRNVRTINNRGVARDWWRGGEIRFSFSSRNNFSIRRFRNRDLSDVKERGGE